jgi:hypothetical protein
LLAVLPHYLGRRSQPNPDPTLIVDKGALGGYTPDDILGGQYRRHPTLRRTPCIGCNPWSKYF